MHGSYLMSPAIGSAVSRSTSTVTVLPGYDFPDATSPQTLPSATRGRGHPAAGFASHLRLAHLDQVQQRQRFYVLTWQPGLFRRRRLAP